MTRGEEVRVRTGIRSTLSLLRRNPAFARLYAAQLVSFMGDWFTTVALVGLVEEHTGSSMLVALVLAAQTIPFALFSPLGGYLADRFDRRRLMIGADVGRAALALGFLFVDGPGEVWLAFVLVGAIGGMSAVFEPASMAAVPNLVEPEDLPGANVLVGSAWGAMLAVGGALGGLVAVSLGRDAAFVGDALSFGVSALLLLGIRRRFAEPRPARRPARLLESVTEAARYAAADRRVLALLAVKSGFGFAVGVLGLLPLLAIHAYHADDLGTGILFAVRGVWALVGPFLVHRFTTTLRRLFGAVGISFLVYGLGYGLVAFMPTLAAAAVWVLVAHLGGGAQWMLSTYALQRIVPDHHRGRIFAFDYGLVTLTVAISLTLTGWAADHFPARHVMLALAAISLVWGTVWTAATTGLRRRATLDPEEPTSRPAASQAEEARSRQEGPPPGGSP
jgi:MFS family permease